MKTHTVIDGNAFYEIDEKCYEELMRKREETEKKKGMEKRGTAGDADAGADRFRS